MLSDGSFSRDRTGVADRVIADLRAQILSGKLVRGTRLPSEKELAAHYQVSSPTIREVIRALSAMSLVEVRHGAGTFVTAESATLMAAAMAAVVALENVDLASILELSEVLYLKAVALAVGAAHPDELGALMAVAARFAPSMTDSEFAATLKEFLNRLVAASHDRLLIALSEYLVETQISLAEEAARRSPSAWKRIAGRLTKERIAIAEALQARDAEAAELAVQRYVQRGKELVRKFGSPD
jgi:DNA-binding FadR family transcriptional regulator